MKELKKKKKKTKVFENLNVNAFHENGGQHTNYGYYDRRDASNDYGYQQSHRYQQYDGLADDDLLF